MARKYFMNKTFLTNEEMKYGNNENLENINRSMMRLKVLSERNWSPGDISKEVYSTTSNFKQKHNNQFNGKFNSILLAASRFKDNSRDRDSYRA